ncbi:hypothetical protein BG015_010274 [Linnemannia schmuckeri]|uniref:Uncharacterized protein n=1 Tax=Linnemannia schmuckeri TaxID=64567 RepID=A0A9P5RWD8_9FUNG|nr:hypothetical protein BG015_010274 [Linnemannia schmuckeri]
MQGDDQLQAVRAVYKNGLPTPEYVTSEGLQVACYLDATSKKHIVLWEDIQAAFKDVVHPPRITAGPDIALDVVIEGSTAVIADTGLDMVETSRTTASSVKDNVVFPGTEKVVQSAKRQAVGDIVTETYPAFDTKRSKFNSLLSPESPTSQSDTILSSSSFSAPSSSNTAVSVSSTSSSLTSSSPTSSSPISSFSKCQMNPSDPKS